MARPTSPLRADPDSVEIFRIPTMVDTGDYPKPWPFGLGQHADPTGHSDHFPILTISEIA